MAIRQKRSERCQVWDVPTRVFHWLMVFGFTTSYLTGEDDRWALTHITAGYMVLGLIIFRLLWGLIGTHHARFKNFICGPKAVVEYMVCLCTKKTRHYTGHNPAGAVAIFLLLLLGLLVTVSGVMISDEISFPGIEEIHEISSKSMLVIVLIHISGVFVSSFLHRENLIRAMINGCKPNCEGETIGQTYRWLGVAMGLCVILFWTWSFKDKIL
jgi:cytochrome b